MNKKTRRKTPFSFSRLVSAAVLLGVLYAYTMPAYSQQNLVWYDVDYSVDNARPDGNGAWFPLNPNSPNIVPSDGQIYRTATPQLGLYPSNNDEVIRQHAYWFNALGITGAILDWTNLSPDIQKYSTNVINNTKAIFASYSTLDASIPAPKVVIAIRLKSLNSKDKAIAQEYANVAYSLYTQYPNLATTLPDDPRPLIIVFVDFNDHSWLNGPQWNDSRFNMRFMNGYLENQPGLVQPLTSDVDKIINDYPYWDFVDNVPANGKAGSYKGIISQKLINGKEVTEYGGAWIGIHVGGMQWDGVFGSTTLINKISNKCLDDTGASSANGTQMQQWACNDLPQQRWTLIPHGQYNIILNENSGLALDNTGASISNGTIVQQWGGNNTQQQDWQIEPNTNSSIINRLSGKCIDVTGASTSDGSPIQQWSCNGFDQQSWSTNIKSVFSRQLAPLALYPPEILMVARFNYAVGNYLEPQEGISLVSSTQIEPTNEYGYHLFDTVRKQVAIFRDLNQSAPTYDGAGIGINGKLDSLWKNWPTEYQVSQDHPDPAAPWQMFPYGGVPALPAGHYMRTRNTFGASAWHAF